jgi:hypothetical protein
MNFTPKPTGAHADVPRLGDFGKQPSPLLDELLSSLPDIDVHVRDRGGVRARAHCGVWTCLHSTSLRERETVEGVQVQRYGRGPPVGHLRQWAAIANSRELR